MANVSTIGSSSRDYSTPELWEADTDDDLVTAAEGETGQMYADSEFSGTALTIKDATVDSTYFRILEAASGEEWNEAEQVGVFLNGGFITDGVAIIVNESYVELRGFHVRQEGPAPDFNSDTVCISYRNAARVDNVTENVSGRMIAGTTGDKAVFRVARGDGHVFYNCLAIANNNGTAPFGGAKFGFDVDGNARNIVALQCGAVQCDTYGFQWATVGGTTSDIRNCWSIDGGTADFSIAFASSGTFEYCASSDTSATGTGAVTGIDSSDFVDYDPNTGRNWHPTPGTSDLEDAGVDLTSTVPNDFDGRAHDGDSSGVEIGPYDSSVYSGSGTGSFPELTGSGSGDASMDATGSGDLPALTGTGTGDVSLAGTGAGSLPPLEGAGVGAASLAGTGAGSLPPMEGTGTGDASLAGTGAGSLPPLEGTGVGTASVSGSGTGSLPPLEGTGAGTASVSGSGSGSLPALTGAGSGVLIVSGTGAGSFPPLEGSGVAVLVVSGTGVGAFPPLEGSGTGTLTGAPTPEVCFIDVEASRDEILDVLAERGGILDVLAQRDEIVDVLAERGGVLAILAARDEIHDVEGDLCMGKRDQNIADHTDSRITIRATLPDGDTFDDATDIVKFTLSRITGGVPSRSPTFELSNAAASAEGSTVALTTSATDPGVCTVTLYPADVPGATFAPSKDTVWYHQFEHFKGGIAAKNPKVISEGKLTFYVNVAETSV